MALIDDLKGLLSPEEYAKLESKPGLVDRAKKGDELYSYYVGEETDPPVARTAPVTDPPAARSTPGNPFSLSDIEGVLDRKLGKINETIDTRISEVVKTRGDELYNNVRSGVRNDALQLVKIYTRHEKVTGKEWDDAEEVKFNEFLKTNNDAVKAGGGKLYKTISDAYNDYIAPTVTARTIESEVDKRVKAQSGTHVPGTTPAPATSGNIMKFIRRGGPADGAPATGAQKAAAALDKLTASRNEAAS